MSKAADIAVVVLAAGKGVRMRSDRPKVLFDLAGAPMVRYVVEAALALRPTRCVVVVGHGAAEVRAALAGLPVDFALQRVQHGTGHAVRCAERTLRAHEGPVLVLYGDIPLVRTRTLADLVALHRRRKAAATLLTMFPGDPAGYGRIVRDATGAFAAILEDKDATPAQREIGEVNTGIGVFAGRRLWPALRRLRTDNAQGEQYLTDVPLRFLAEGLGVETLPAADASEVAGVNSLSDLAAAARAARDRILLDHLHAGVRIVDPGTTWIDRDVRIGAGTVVEPFTVISGGSEIGRGCVVGPFAHLRAGTRLADGAAVGNFVEVKKSVLGRGVKAKHLAYLGDAQIGEGTNVGCGTITANYDGRRKHPTTIGRDVHVGSGTVFVAPVTVGDGATTGAGAIVLSGRDVPPGATVVGVPAKVLARGEVRR